MKDHPILFSTDMVQAILDGRKTQTRRVIKPQPEYRKDEGKYFRDPKEYLAWKGYLFCTKEYLPKLCPYGKIGDRLWVRETHYRFGKWIKNGISKTGRQKWRFCPANNEVRFFNNPPPYTKSNSYRKIAWYKRPSIFMPRTASRITLEITDIRVERVQDISTDDILHEGNFLPNVTQGKELLKFNNHQDVLDKFCKEVFQELWDSINKKRGYSWDSNPWVWVVEFKKVGDSK